MRHRRRSCRQRRGYDAAHALRTRGWRFETHARLRSVYVFVEINVPHDHNAGFSETVNQFCVTHTAKNSPWVHLHAAPCGPIQRADYSITGAETQNAPRPGIARASRGRSGAIRTRTDRHGPARTHTDRPGQTGQTRRHDRHTTRTDRHGAHDNTDAHGPTRTEMHGRESELDGEDGDAQGPSRYVQRVVDAPDTDCRAVLPGG